MPDNPEYEYALATTVQEEPEEPTEEAERLMLAGSMVRELLRASVEACDGDAGLLLVVLMRLSGRTLEEIGRSRGISRQAVCKRLHRLARRAPAFEHILMRGLPLDIYTDWSKYDR